MAKKSAVIAKSTPNPKSKTPSNPHPPYFEMITDAISTLKDRTGSSQQAISKLIENKYNNALPDNFKKLLSVQLKRLVESGKLVKVKNSYKIPSTPNISNIKEMKPKKLIAKPKDNEELTSDRKVKKTKRLSQVKTPEALKRKDEKKAAMASVGDRKMKRLSQVKTPESTKKKMTKKKKAGN